MALSNLPLGRNAYKRTYGREPEIVLRNRFFEQNPSNREDGVALLSRPGSTFRAACGTGPIRANWYQDGTLNGNLFTVSGDKLFMFDKDLARTDIGGTIAGGTPVMAGTDEYMFICDGSLLQFYDGVGSRATSLLTFVNNPTNGQQVVIGTQTYTFNTVLGGANSILIGLSAADSLLNLTDAINRDLGEGVRYGANTQVNAYAVAVDNEDLTMSLTAKTGGAAGNTVATTTTVTAATFPGGTMSGGVDDSLSGIPTPDDVGIVSICVLNGYVLCAAAQSDRIYFIRPGAIIIDPLDFFTAEAQPDENISLMTVGDQFWAFAAQTTQPFYATGDLDAPFAPVQGRAFSQGVVGGTAVLVNQQVVVVGNDNIVYMISGGPRPISTNGISERIRKALVAERDAP
jgi:hypothetical protein